MGMFTSVYKNIKCERCGRKFRCEFQIKTGHDFCETFDDGSVPPPSVPQGKYHAYFHPLCTDCLSVLNGVSDVLHSRTEDLILRLEGYEILRSGEYGQSILYKGNKIAEGYVSRRLMLRGELESPQKTEEYKRLVDEMLAFWRSQTRLFNVSDHLKASFGQQDTFDFVNGDKVKVWRLSYGLEYDTKRCEVSVGKRIRAYEKKRGNTIEAQNVEIPPHGLIPAKSKSRKKKAKAK